MTFRLELMLKLLKRGIYPLLAAATVGLLWLLLATDDTDYQVQVVEDARETGKPDIIVITVDTLRADRLGSYGYADAKTPTLDRFAEEGLLFVHATVPIPRTTPALASMLTGLTPQHHGSREVWQRVHDVARLSELLRVQGYRTIGVSANPAAGPRQGLDHGFDTFISSHDLRERFERGHADIVTNAALEAVDTTDPHVPVFLWVHYLDPHWTYDPPPVNFWGTRPAAPACREVLRLLHEGTIGMGQLSVDADGYATRSLADCSALYDSEVTFTDGQIGRLIEGLRAKQRWDRAIRVFSADHGENLGEDGYFYNHGPSLADASLRIPLIIAGPGVPAGKRDQGIVRIEDIMPTILQMSGTPRSQWPSPLDGIDLSWRWDSSAQMPSQPVLYAVAEGGGALHLGSHTFLVSGRQGKRYCLNEERYSLCFDPREGETRAFFFDRETDPQLRTPLPTIPPDARTRLIEGSKHWKPETARHVAVRTREYKLVGRPEFDGSYRFALYDLAHDPDERTDVIAEHPKEAAALRTVLERWRQDLPLFEVPERSDEDVNELRALGYIH